MQKKDHRDMLIEQLGMKLKLAIRIIEESMVIDTCGFDIHSESIGTLKDILIYNDIKARNFLPELYFEGACSDEGGTTE